MGSFIRTDAVKATTVPGVFACGDAARMAGSVSLSVGDGALAGVADLRRLRWALRDGPAASMVARDCLKEGPLLETERKPLPHSSRAAPHGSASGPHDVRADRPDAGHQPDRGAAHDGGAARGGICQLSSVKGHGGGWTQSRPLSRIALLDVYQALGAPELFALGMAKDTPACLVEQAVNGALGRTLEEAERQLLARFGEVKLSEIAADFAPPRPSMGPTGLSMWPEGLASGALPPTATCADRPPGSRRRSPRGRGCSAARPFPDRSARSAACPATWR